MAYSKSNGRLLLIGATISRRGAVPPRALQVEKFPGTFQNFVSTVLPFCALESFVLRLNILLVHREKQVDGGLRWGTRYVTPSSGGRYHFRGRGGVRWTRGKRDSNIQKYYLRISVSHSRVPGNPLHFRNTSPRLKLHILSLIEKLQGIRYLNELSVRHKKPIFVFKRLSKIREIFNIIRITQEENL